jgi:hypothetical protein
MSRPGDLRSAGPLAAARLREGARDLRSAIPRREPSGDRGELMAVVHIGWSKELRLSLVKEDRREPEISIRIWAPDMSGQMAPMARAGFSLRRQHFAAFAEGVAEAVEYTRADLLEEVGRG